MPLPMFKPRTEKKAGHPVVIAVAAGKGGVGKSSIAVNLALALKELGHSVGLIDTDVYGPSVRRMLPEDRLPAQKGERMTPALSFGVETMSMAFFRREGQASVMRAPIANSLVSQFLKQVAWGDLDFLIIDFPPGTGDVQLTLGQQANLTGALLVTTPQEIALMDVRKAADMFGQVRVPILGVVENMSFFVGPTGEKSYIFGKDGGVRLAAELGVPLLGQIPLDPSFAHACDKGRPLIPTEAEHSITRNFLELAVRLKEHVALELEHGADFLRQFTLQWVQGGAENSLGTQTPLEEVKALKRSHAVGIRGIRQEGNHALSIVWSDGTVGEYILAELQRRCPCAGCVDEGTGRRLHDPSQISDDLEARKVSSVGRYALRVDFSSGCSNGIYSFDFLRKMAADTAKQGVKK